MFDLTNSVTTLTTLELYNHICQRTNMDPTDDNYSSFMTYVDSVMSTYTIDNPYAASIALTAYTTAGRQIYTLDYQSCTIIAAGMVRNATDLLRDLDYLFNGTQAAGYLQNLQQTYGQNIQLSVEGDSPVFSDGRTGLSSLVVCRLASDAKGTTIRHADVLRKITNLSKRINAFTTNTCYELVEDEYLDARNIKHRYVWLSNDYSLLVAGTYSPEVQNTIITEMNRLRNIVNNVPYLPTVPVIDITQPVVIPPTYKEYYTINDAILKYGGSYDSVVLDATNGKHQMLSSMILENNIVVPAYHITVWTCAYNIQPEAWLIAPLPEINITPTSLT